MSVKRQRWKEEDISATLKDIRQHIDDEAEEASSESSEQSVEKNTTFMDVRAEGTTLLDYESSESENSIKEDSLESSETVNSSRVLVESAAVPDVTYLRPGSTDSKNLNGFYLCYNSMGFISKTQSQINIHFHDISRLPLRFSDTHGFFIGALSENAALLASDTYIAFKSFNINGANPDWNTNLPCNELIHLATLSARYCILSTSKYLRIFSYSGIETTIIEPAEKIFSITATSSSIYHRSDTLTVLYEAQAGIASSKIYALQEHRLLFSSSITTSKLDWIGWGDDGFLYASRDRCKSVNMLVSAWGGSWIPVFQNEEGKHHWLWSIKSGKLIAYHLEPNQMSITIGTQSPVEHLSFSAPVIQSGNEKLNVQKEWIIRYSARQRELSKSTEGKYTEELAKCDLRLDAVLYDVYCSFVDEELTARALDLSCAFQLRNTMEAAIRYAHSKHQTKLMEGVHKILKLRFGNPAMVSSANSKHQSDQLALPVKVEQPPVEINISRTKVPQLKPERELQHEIPTLEKTEEFKPQRPNFIVKKSHLPINEAERVILNPMAQPSEKLKSVLARKREVYSDDDA